MMRKRRKKRYISRLAPFLALVLGSFGANSTSADPAVLPDCEANVATKYGHGTLERKTPLGNEGYFSPEMAAARARCRKDWTILVFMAADNDLEPYALWDLEEMEGGYASGRVAAGSTSRTDLLVEFDARDELGSRRLHVFQKPEPLKPGLTVDDFKNRSPSVIRSPIVERVQEDLGTPATRLRDFLAWGLERYPSKHVMVIVWGHGQGFTSIAGEARDVAGDFKDRGFGGLAFDASESEGGYLSIPQLRWALRRASLDAHQGKQFDIYASDACLMQMIEVATEISDSAEWIVGSAQTQVYQGLPYRRLLYELNTGRLGRGVIQGLSETADPARRVAELIPPLLKASLSAGGTQAAVSRAADELSASALSTSELRHRLLPSLEGVAEELARWIGAKDAAATARRLAVAAAAKDAVTFPGGARDLGSWLSRLEDAARRADPALVPESPLRREIALARSALRMTIASGALGSSYTDPIDGRFLDFPGSLAAWIPSDPRERAERIADVSRSSFFRSLPAWRGLSDIVFGPQ